MFLQRLSGLLHTFSLTHFTYTSDSAARFSRRHRFLVARTIHSHVSIRIRLHLALHVLAGVRRHALVPSAWLFATVDVLPVFILIVPTDEARFDPERHVIVFIRLHRTNCIVLRALHRVSHHPSRVPTSSVNRRRNPSHHLGWLRSRQRRRRHRINLGFPGYVRVYKSNERVCCVSRRRVASRGV